MRELLSPLSRYTLFSMNAPSLFLSLNNLNTPTGFGRKKEREDDRAIFHASL